MDLLIQEQQSLSAVERFARHHESSSGAELPVYQELIPLSRPVVAQTQAMPGYTNLLEVVFEEPGDYRILCLEYCGMVHHGMAVTLTAVKAP